MKQLLLLAVIHLLIFHQYKKDKSEVLAPKKDSRQAQAVVHSDNGYLFQLSKTRANEKPDTVNKSMRPMSIKPTHAVYFLPAMPAILK